MSELNSLKGQISELKEKASALEAELVERTSEEFERQLKEKGKTHGLVSSEIDGVLLQYERKQTVSWSQDKLRALWEALPKEMGDKLIDLKFGVSESSYKAQIDPNIIQALTDARTTKLSEPTIKLK